MFNLVNLDERTRQFMLEEVNLDLRQGTLYVSPRLSNTGTLNYVTLLREAIRAHDGSWLANELRGRKRLRSSEHRRKPTGGYTIARIPLKAADVFAEGEFNRYYMRALCRRALADKVPEVIVYRARQASQPRPESERLLGTGLNPAALLADLRNTQGTNTQLGLPSGPASGLSVRLP